MKSYLPGVLALAFLLTGLAPAATAGGVIIKHSTLYPNTYFHSYSNPSTVVLQNGTVTYISSGRSYSYGYPAYPAYPVHPRNKAYGHRGYRGHKGHRDHRGHRGHRGHRDHHGKKLNKKLLPSTHIYGAYPTRKTYSRPRINPHASSWQKKHALGEGTYGYNHFSRRGHGKWYRY